MMNGAGSVALSMVAASGLDQPSMAATTMSRAVEVALEVIAGDGEEGRSG